MNRPKTYIKSLDMDTNVVNIQKVSQNDYADMYQTTLK